MIVASPYVFVKTYAFTITSQYGTISRQICNDRFDEIDMAMYDNDPSKEGSFRKGYFAFIFCMIYLLPSIVILTTCVKIAISLLQPITVENSVMRRRKDKGTGHEENKRKVMLLFVCYYQNLFVYCYDNGDVQYNSLIIFFFTMCTLLISF